MRILLLYIVLAFGLSAQAKTAYIGVAGSGGGQGLTGHTFILIAEEPEQILSATYYQYAIRIPEGQTFDFSMVTSLGAFPFVVDSGSAWKFIKSYNKEDRVVMLYQLRLTDAQIARIEDAVLRDKAARSAMDHFDYKVDANNCATKVFDLINSVVEPNLRIDYTPLRQSLANFELPRPGRMSMVIPLSAAPNLKRHPLVVGEMRFRQQSMVDLEVSLTAFEQLTPLFTACSTSTKLQEMLSQLYGNTEIRHSERYLRVFSAALKKCAATPALKEIFNGHIDFLRYDTDDPAFLKLSQGYFL